MTFIKSLRIKKEKKGQVSLEYFVIFAVVALVTIVSFSAFLPKVQRALQGDSKTKGLFQDAIGKNGLNVENK